MSENNGQPPLVYGPLDGHRLLTGCCDAARYRWPDAVWKYNPWTGLPRHQEDIGSDPHGLLIWSDAWGPMRAAEPEDIPGQLPLLTYSPLNGRELVGGELRRAALYRWPDAVWKYNPWTGAKRLDNHIAADPQGERLLGAYRRPAPDPLEGADVQVVADGGFARQGAAASAGVQAEQKARPFSHYFKPCPFTEVDVYRVLLMFEVADPCLQHAIKKLLVPGSRGGKDAARDVREAMASLQRWVDMRAEEVT